METQQNIQLRKRRRGSFKLRLTLCLIIFLPSVAVVMLSVNLRPAMSAQAEARIQSVCSRAMNDAILSVMEDNEAYRDLVKVSENGEHVYLLQANAQRMNLLAANCANAAQDKISQLGKQGISIPLGTITGISFLSGKWPYIRASFTPAGSVQSAFRSEFLEAGINQTLYRVNLNLSSSIRLILPGLTKTVTVNAEAAISENVLVGEVPQVYTNVPDTNDMLNVIPTDLP